MTDRDAWRKRGDTVRQVTTALTVSGLIVAGPLGCGAAGYFLGRWAGHPYGGALLGGALGFGLAVYEVFRIVKRLSR